MELRSTPESMKSRDHKIFPRLAKSFKERKYPLYYYVRKKQKWTTITVDYFFVPHEIRRNLQRLYRQYIEWLISRPGTKKNSYYLCNFQDYAGIEVLTEHAPWWIELFESAAPLLVDSYRLTEADQDEDRREEREKQRVRSEAKIQKIRDKWQAKLDRESERQRRREAQKGNVAFFDGVEIPALEKPTSLKSIANAFFQRQAQLAQQSQGKPTIRPYVPGAHQEIIQYIEAQSDEAFRNKQPLIVQTRKRGAGNMVKLFRDGTKVAVQTNIQDEREFTAEFAATVAELVVKSPQDENELSLQLNGWLTPFVEICCKLRGYKSATREERLITAGEVPPQDSALVVSMDDKRKIVVEAPRQANGAVA